MYSRKLRGVKINNICDLKETDQYVLQHFEQKLLYFRTLYQQHLENKKDTPQSPVLVLRSQLAQFLHLQQEYQPQEAFCKHFCLPYRILQILCRHSFVACWTKTGKEKHNVLFWYTVELHSKLPASWNGPGTTVVLYVLLIKTHKTKKLNNLVVHNPGLTIGDIFTYSATLTLYIINSIKA